MKGPAFSMLVNLCISCKIYKYRGTHHSTKEHAALLAKLAVSSHCKVKEKLGNYLEILKSLKQDSKTNSGLFNELNVDKNS